MDLIADTNVWLRIADDHAVQHQAVRRCVAELIASGARIYLVPQNVIEFWAVATRSLEINGLGWTIERADEEVAKMREQFQLLTENERIFEKWAELVRADRITGKQVHDARMAAQLAVHNIRHLLTFNDQHFRRFAWISILRPDDFRED